jgi:hypothetical protein
MSNSLVILCDKCGHNRGTFIDMESKYCGIAECNKCYNGVLVHLTEKYLNDKRNTNI